MEVIIIKNHVKTLIVKLVLFIELIIYCAFIYIDYTNNLKTMYSAVLKYFGILLCLFLSILIGNNGHDKIDTIFLRLAIFLTALADLCMIILGLNELGIMIFCLVQITYIIRHRRAIERRYNLNFLVVTIIVIILIVIPSGNNLLIEDLGYEGIKKVTLIIGFIYAVILLYSVYIGWKTLKGAFYPMYSRYLVAIGMILFLLCDINVALSVILKDLSILIWIFYLPSQILLVLSGYNRKTLK
ncbi:lysoplasmalogenase family protein [Clostridium sp. BSD9I1]|uniref:lysoplasmalogenase family protein n=1 Tax=Clostridium sp. BSD9I1 TaxID=2003589 RepID=UPI001644E90A|nr:lysoplasmalogenase family protein [Clostridium sp. BSD9I1]